MTTNTINIGDRLDFEFDWRGAAPGPWLQVGETVASVSANATGPLAIEGTPSPGDVVQVWVTTVAGATSGQTGAINCQITTSTGRRKSASISLRLL